MTSATTPAKASTSAIHPHGVLSEEELSPADVVVEAGVISTDVVAVVVWGRTVIVREGVDVAGAGAVVVTATVVVSAVVPGAARVRVRVGSVGCAAVVPGARVAVAPLTGPSELPPPPPPPHAPSKKPAKAATTRHPAMRTRMTMPVLGGRGHHPRRVIMRRG